MARTRVKLDLGPHGKVLASVLDCDDAKKVAASRFGVDPTDVGLFVSDGEDLWELHPSAFQDVVSENGVIVAKPLALSRSVASTSRTEATAAPSGAAVVAKHDSNAAPASSSLLHASASISPTAQGASSTTISPSTPYSRPVRRRSPSTSSSRSVTSTSSDSSSPSSSSSTASSSSSSSSDGDRRSESVQDVTASSATVRTVIGPNGLPVSSKERWDPKTHRLMFEKLNEILSSETIFYTRKYTEERYRIFQLLIDNYGDMGVKGNFLRGRTAAALISRVSGVLRTARERGEKIKQPFKFFFPNKKDDEVLPRAATEPATLASTNATNQNARTAVRPNAGSNRAQTVQSNSGDGTPARNRPSQKKRAATRARAAATAASSASAPASASTSQAPTELSLANHSGGTSATGRGKAKGKGKGNQGNQSSQHTAGGQGHPPEIRRSTANAAAAASHPSSQPRTSKRPADGTTPASKKAKTNKQPRPAQTHTAIRPGAPTTIHQSPSASPQHRPHNDDRRSQRLPRNPSPHRGWDTWIRARDEPNYGDSAAGLRDDGGSRSARQPTIPLPRRPSWTDRVEDRNASLFRAETRSPPPQPQQHSTPRRGRSGSRGQASPHATSPRTRRNAVERALENLAQAGADASSLSENARDASRRRRGDEQRAWHDTTDDDLRRSVPRHQRNPHGQHRSDSDNGWPMRHVDRPRTPPRAD